MRCACGRRVRRNARPDAARLAPDRIVDRSAQLDPLETVGYIYCKRLQKELTI